MKASRELLLRQILRFGAVGTGGFIVNAGLVELASPFCGPYYAQVIAFPVAVAFTWFFNRRYTFAPSHREWRDEAVRYLLFNLVGWAANNAAYFGLVFWSPLAHAHPSIAAAGGSLAGMGLNFMFSRWLVFGNTAEGQRLAPAADPGTQAPTRD